MYVSSLISISSWCKLFTNIVSYHSDRCSRNHHPLPSIRVEVCDGRDNRRSVRNICLVRIMHKHLWWWRDGYLCGRVNQGRQICIVVVIVNLLWNRIRLRHMNINIEKLGAVQELMKYPVLCIVEFTSINLKIYCSNWHPHKRVFSRALLSN